MTKTFPSCFHSSGNGKICKWGTLHRFAAAQINYSTAGLLSWIAFSLGYVNRPHTECIMNIVEPKVAVTKFRTSAYIIEKFNLSLLAKPEAIVGAG